MDRGKAGTGASAMKWEHKVEFLRYGNDAPIDLNRTMEIELNRLGTEGWEAVGLVDYNARGTRVILKRRSN